ncbi:hypothetical protein ACFT9I_25625 [Streptomyces sp. NPDC057137]|uniref:hypothetical protein n=1 Tax=Streptomyces sp. NPDC057137 TaxID=3346030 RepID=UPI00362648B7
MPAPTSGDGAPSWGRAFELVGVRGALYRPGYPAPIAWDANSVGFEDPRIRWIRAGQSLVRLRGITVIRLGSLRPDPSTTHRAQRPSGRA